MYPICVEATVSKSYIILINPEDTSKCFHHCTYLSYSDYTSNIKNGMCSLFDKKLKHIYKDEHTFVRCEECVKTTNKTLNIKNKEIHYK